MSVTSNQGSSESTPLLPDSLRRNSSFVNADGRGISPIVAERRDSVTVRRPVQYYSVNRDVGSSSESHDDNTQATISRYKYYSKLAAPAEDRETALLMPHHVVPSNFFVVIPIKQEGGKQSSIITIFSIWNTMMGTSVLSMPWALEQAGFACGIAIMIIMSGMTLYTAYRVMNSIKTLGPQGEQEGIDFPDVCRYWLGRWGEYVGIAFSIITLLGAAIVYWVLMANFLYNSVKFIYEEARHEMNTSKAIVIGNLSFTDAYCPHPPWHPVPTVVPTNITTTPTPPPSFSTTFSANPTPHIDFTDTQSSVFSAIKEFYANPKDATFNKVWQQTLTVPFVLVILLGPLVNFKSPTFFTKFNALGTFSILYILTFVAVKAGLWGIHVDFTNTESGYYVTQFEWTFPALTGTLSLALFIHNCVISIMRTQQTPENNGRDLSIAYCCVTFTYVFIGVLFYVSFPLPKDCIEDNLLNNFRSSDVMSFVARIFLFFQMVTVFPLLMYILRAQTLSYLFGNVYPSWKHVLVVNILVLAICVIFAIFLPQIGTIIRFSGAICGLAYIFALPCLVHMLSLKRRGKLTWPMLIIHSTLISVGVGNFIAQFVILGKT